MLEEKIKEVARKIFKSGESYKNYTSNLARNAMVEHYADYILYVYHRTRNDEKVNFLNKYGILKTENENYKLNNN